MRALPPLERLDFTPFDPAAKRSEAKVRRDGAILWVVLGSPPVVQALAQPAPGLDARVEELAASGARVLAVAAGPEGALVVRGLLVLADTPRKDAAGLVQALRGLGIRILMVSGDSAATARAVAAQVGLGTRFGEVSGVLQGDPLQYDGFAHCYPQDKHRLVQTLQRAGRVVGMTGDGINDAPALRQAEVGIAVSSASDVAKAAAQVVLTRPGLDDMVAVVHSGRRVYRRMLTWTLTKIARTVELAALLAIGYVATGFLVTSLLLIAVLVILNDVVTITLATDRAWISPVPEQRNVAAIGKVAGVFALAWLLLAFLILWLALKAFHLPVAQIQTLMFAYLIYSAQATIYLTRVRGRFWSFAPSRYVALATLGNVAIASAMGCWASSPRRFRRDCWLGRCSRCWWPWSCWTRSSSGWWAGLRCSAPGSLPPTGRGSRHEDEACGRIRCARRWPAAALALPLSDLRDRRRDQRRLLPACLR